MTLLVETKRWGLTKPHDALLRRVVGREVPELYEPCALAVWDHPLPQPAHAALPPDGHKRVDDAPARRHSSTGLTRGTAGGVGVGRGHALVARRVAREHTLAVRLHLHFDTATTQPPNAVGEGVWGRGVAGVGGAHRSVGEAMNWPIMPALEPATIPFHSAKWPSASLPSTLSRKNSYLTYTRA